MDAAATIVQVPSALAIVYASGYVTGALLLPPSDEDTSAIGLMRLVSGLLLSSIGFLLSLAVGVPWFIGPAVLVVFAVLVHRCPAFRPPRPTMTITPGGVAAAAVSAIAVAPLVIASVRMGAGAEFPPVFFNVDSSYFLEKVHALVHTERYPPESLGVLGGRAAYHFGTQGIAAFISRASGVAPHHSLFLIVLPLFACGIVAAAAVTARHLAPSLPSVIAMPMLLTATPTLWLPFWQVLWPALSDAVSWQSLDPLNGVVRNYELWGVASNNGQNVGTTFIVLAALAGIAMAPARGWRLPVFLIGSAVIFKAPTGVALASGFTVAQAYRAIAERNIRSWLPIAGVCVVFAAVYAAFWIVPGLPVEYKTELAPLFHFKYLTERERVPGFAADLVWLMVPALMLLPIRAPRRGIHSLSLLLFALTPLVVVNTLQAVDLRPGFGIDQNWPQVLIPVPLLLHAFAIAVAAARWGRLHVVARMVFIALVLMTVLPPLSVAARYAQVLVVRPAEGHEYVDNRPIAEALHAIPLRRSVVVTNDLRYPAEGFDRPLRQMQIPGLFGHQAFAVNYIYESYPFSRDRLTLQRLLEAEQWTSAIEEAARAHGWTHLLIRKDYVHPMPIPLARLFENELYSVYRFR